MNNILLIVSPARNIRLELDYCVTAQLSMKDLSQYHHLGLMKCVK